LCLASLEVLAQCRGEARVLRAPGEFAPAPAGLSHGAHVSAPVPKGKPGFSLRDDPRLWQFAPRRTTIARSAASSLP